MSKYILHYTKGIARYKFGAKPKKISEAQAKRYEDKGIKVYHSKEEAEEDC